MTLSILQLDSEKRRFRLNAQARNVYFWRKSTMVYLSIGSNLGDRLLHLQLALGMITYRIGEVKLISSIVETPSWGFEGEAFYNACLGVETNLPPNEVLAHLLAIEEFLGRKRNQQKGYQSRTIDLDILLYDDLVLNTETLTLPHPRMHERNFVLAPLTEIAPDSKHPIKNITSRELFEISEDKTTAHRVETPLLHVKKLNHIAIEGNIGAGKTTFAQWLNKALGGRLLLENFYDNPYLEDFYRDPEKYALAVEKAFLNDRVQQQKLFFNTQKPLPVIADYCLEKSLLFAQQNLKKEDVTVYHREFKKMVATLPQPDVVFFLEQSITELQNNIKKRGRDFEQNIEKDYLEKIEQGYNQWQSETNLKRINFSLNGGDINQDSKVLYRFLMDLFRL